MLMIAFRKCLREIRLNYPYRFGSIFMPHTYPRQAPLVYVTPTETMTVRPGQHVDPQGQVYHPYLVGWAEFWDVRLFLLPPSMAASC